MAYYGYVVKVEHLREHTNADRLQIATVFNNDVVVGKDIVVGDTMIYFPSDGKLSYHYAYHNGLLREDERGNKLNGYLDPKKRNIKAIRLRGEKSDGILLSIDSLRTVVSDRIVDGLRVGDKIDVLDGTLICEKYVPYVKPVKNANQKYMGSKISLKKQFPLFEHHVDTEQFDYNVSDFKKGDIVTMSLKLHGTSGKTGYQQKVKDKSFKDKVLNFFNIRTQKPYELVSGTRKTILDGFDGGYYGTNEFRKGHHDFFEGKLEKGMTVYYEIVGWVNDRVTIMPTVNNNKLNDKKFNAVFGEKTTFSYGCKQGESDIYVYRITKTDEDGNVFEFPTWMSQNYCEKIGVNHVPVIETFIVDDIDDLINKAEENHDGHDLIDPTHIREGIVFRIENRDKFRAYKKKGWNFKVLEGIIKEEALEPDLEEQEN